MSRYVALLRGINVGRAQIGMAQLRDVLASHGYDGVRTYLRSGNVLFSSPQVDPEQLAQDFERRISERFGQTVRVIVRSQAELAAIVEYNPLGAIADDPARYLVAFLAAAPDPQRLQEIDPAEYEPDRFEVHGREIYLWYPNGVLESRFSHALLERRLKVTATARNWNTVTRLLAMAKA